MWRNVVLVFVIVTGRTRPRLTSLSMLTNEKELHCLLFLYACIRVSFFIYGGLLGGQSSPESRPESSPEFRPESIPVSSQKSNPKSSP